MLKTHVTTRWPILNKDKPALYEDERLFMNSKYRKHSELCIYQNLPACIGGNTRSYFFKLKYSWFKFKIFLSSRLVAEQRQKKPVCLVIYPRKDEMHACLHQRYEREIKRRQLHVEFELVDSSSYDENRYAKRASSSYVRVSKDDQFFKINLLWDFNCHSWTDLHIINMNICFKSKNKIAHSAEAVKYTDCLSAEG